MPPEDQGRGDALAVVMESFIMMGSEELQRNGELKRAAAFLSSLPSCGERQAMSTIPGCIRGKVGSVGRWG
jgi:hypothetical protein